MKIAVNAKGEALFTYNKADGIHHVLVWGAINAIAPTGRRAPGEVQARLFRRLGLAPHALLEEVRLHVRPLRRPGACESRRSLQGARRLVLGGAELAAAASGSRLHAVGRGSPRAVARGLALVGRHRAARDRLGLGLRRPLPGLFGRFTYRGSARCTASARRASVRPPTASAVSIYLDTYNSVYGQGWRRENSFVSHNPTGVFCYGFYPFDPTKGGYTHPAGWTAMRGPGTGEKYRLTASGPGVTPNISVIVPGLHPFDKRKSARRHLAAAAVERAALVERPALPRRLVLVASAALVARGLGGGGRQPARDRHADARAAWTTSARAASSRLTCRSRPGTAT